MGKKIAMYDGNEKDKDKESENKNKLNIVLVSIFFLVLVLIYGFTIYFVIGFVNSWLNASKISETASMKASGISEKSSEWKNLTKYQRQRSGYFTKLIWLIVFSIILGGVANVVVVDKISAKNQSRL